MITVYGIKNCDTIKKSLALLAEKDQPATLHDYRKEGLAPALVEEMLSHFSPEALVNRRGTTWRQLSDEDKEAALTVSGFKAIAPQQPALIKRPLVRLSNDKWVLGFAELSNLESY